MEYYDFRTWRLTGDGLCINVLALDIPTRAGQGITALASS
jgi:hypothetical protein